MSTITVYTRTPNFTSNRFEQESSIIWASNLKNSSTATEYGDYIWELKVNLPDSKEGKFIYSDEEVPFGWVWGKKQKYQDIRETWYCFRATQIVSRRLIPRDMFVYLGRHKPALPISTIKMLHSICSIQLDEEGWGYYLKVADDIDKVSTTLKGLGWVSEY